METDFEAAWPFEGGCDFIGDFASLSWTLGLDGAGTASGLAGPESFPPLSV